MGKWLTKFSTRTLENGTNKANTVPSEPSVLGLMVPFPRVQPEKSALPTGAGPNVSEPAPLIAGSPPTLLSVPDGYCPQCGGGFWIRQTWESLPVCGRCSPGPHVESVSLHGQDWPPFPVALSQPVELVIEPACTWDGSPLSPIFWASSDGTIQGPAVPESFARKEGRDWVIVNVEGKQEWIDADTLRSKEDFQAQQEHAGIEEHTRGLQPGWRVTYRNQEGRLIGGIEDKEHCTVKTCLEREVLLTEGQRVPLSALVGVTKTAPDGRFLAGWEVRKHRLDGNKQEAEP